MGGPTTSRNRNVVAFACCCGGSVLSSPRLPACVHSCERPKYVVLSVAFRPDFYFHFSILFGHLGYFLSKSRLIRFTIELFDSVWAHPEVEMHPGEYPSRTGTRIILKVKPEPVAGNPGFQATTNGFKEYSGRPGYLNSPFSFKVGDTTSGWQRCVLWCKI